MFEGLTKIFRTWKEEPYFHVEMETNGRGEGMSIKADWNDAFIHVLDELGYKELETDEDKVDAYIRSCYFKAAREEGIDFVNNMGVEDVE